MATKIGFRKWLRHIFGPTLREMSHSGKVLQTLWDAGQLQRQQKEYLRKVGEIAIGLVREGKLQDMRIERIMAKLERSERILSRQETVLRSYQDRSDIREILGNHRQSEKDGLEAV